MTGTNILIACVALLGFLPLAVFLYKKKRADTILATGRTAWAYVIYKQLGYKRNYEVVYYYFVASDGKEYRGRLTTAPGVHRINDSIEVFYLPHNPKRNTVKGAWKSHWFLAFMIAIAIAVVYMMYELYKMVNK